jgi:hypothetical protein
MRKYLEAEALEALRETLERVSAIKSTELKVESHGKRGAKTIVARVDIYGHPHRLVCKVADICASAQVKQTLVGMKKLHSRLNKEAIPVLIAPVLSKEAQALCRESKTGFIDFHGNARLDLDEVFLVMHSMPHTHRIPSQAEPLPTSETARFAHVA